MLSFAGLDDFDDGLEPDTGMTDTEFEFRVEYIDGNKEAPMAGYPRIEIDVDGNGLIDGPDDGSFSMWPADASEDYHLGKEFFYRTYLPESATIQYRFTAFDTAGTAAEGSETAINWQAGPYVSNDLVDLSVRAGDMEFSAIRPDP